MKAPVKTLSTRIPEDLAIKLKIAAAKTQSTVQAVTIEALRNHLRNHGAKGREAHAE